MGTTYDLRYKPSWSYAASPAGTTTVPATSPAKTDVNPATGKAWTLIEKLLGVAKQGADIYAQVKNPPVIITSGGTPPPPASETFLGMPKTIGIIVTVIVTGLVGFGIYKLATKK